MALPSMDCYSNPSGGEFLLNYSPAALADQPEMMFGLLLSRLNQALATWQTEHPDFIFTSLHHHHGTDLKDSAIHLTFDRPPRGTRLVRYRPATPDEQAAYNNSALNFSED